MLNNAVGFDSSRQFILAHLTGLRASLRTLASLASKESSSTLHRDQRKAFIFSFFFSLGGGKEEEMSS